MATAVERGAPLSTSTTKSRKRSRAEVEKEVSPDGEGDKKRGRPRVDKDDESAADRRRTQIRMAQRAYRQRKESTLEELRKRVSELTNTIELMNKSFLDFTTQVQASSYPSPAGLEELASKFETLVKDARNPADEESFLSLTSTPNATKAHAATTPSSHTLEAADIVPRIKNVPSWLDQSAVSFEANRPKPALNDIGMGYSVLDTDADDNASLDLSMLTKDIMPSVLTVPPTRNAQDQLSLNHPFFDDDDNIFPIPHQPAPPRTFSFQESTFARRLHRACLERAYGLLLDPDMRPATYERVFRLSLLGRSRAKILDIIQIVLARGPHQDLNFWQAPLIHVGGAGTHYAPRDAFGNLLSKRSSRNIGRVGPQTLALLDNASREQLNLDLTVDIAGYEGEWFDPDDVQGYLEERNIYIDAGSTFVEADMILGPSPQQSEGASSSSSITKPQTSAGPTSLHDSTLLDTATAAEWNDLFGGAELTSVGFSDAETGSFMNFLQPWSSIKRPSDDLNGGASHSLRWTDDWMDSMGGTPQDTSLISVTPRTKKVIIDVRKLVKALSTSGVCLGRAPGFRRKDVDHAVELSLVEPI